MTVSSSTSRASYAGDGATVLFAAPFFFLADGDLTVVKRVNATGIETIQILGTDYTVAGAGAPAGSVTMTVAPAAGTTLIILREVDLLQETDYTPADPFPAETHERALDRLTMIAQQLAEVDARSLKYPKSDSAGISSELPASVARASKFLAFDAGGAPLASSGPTVDSSALVVVSASNPGHVNGRIWVDTGTANELNIKMSDGVDWIQLIKITTTTNTTDLVSLAAANVFLADQTIRSTTAGAAQGPLLDLDRAINGAVNNLIGALRLRGNNATGGALTWASLRAKILDATAGSEDAQMELLAVIAGTLQSRWLIHSGLSANGVTGGDQGDGTVNAKAFFDDGAALPTGMATQANQETGTSLILAVPPGRQHFHASAAKAWCKIGGADGSPNIEQGYNVASVTDNGVGDYTPNFTNPFSSATYAYGGAARRTGSAGTSGRHLQQHNTTAPAAGSCRIAITDRDNAESDADCSFFAYGDM